MREYIGEGESIPGVPARDLLEKEYDAIPREWKAIAERIYKKVERKKAEPEPVIEPAIEPAPEPVEEVGD